MADISDSEGLAAWLNGKSPELACVPAARAALRAAPVLVWALHEEEVDRRRADPFPRGTDAMSGWEKA